jgi:putative transposase
MDNFITTYKFRIKDSSHKNFLKDKARSVNFIWNYCNSTSGESAKKRTAGSNISWVTEFDLNNLSKGVSKEIGINSQTIQLVCREFVIKRNLNRKPKLNWRDVKRNLGWIPFKEQSIKIENNSIIFMKRTFHLWQERNIEGKILCGSFNEDSQGRWYVNIICEIEKTKQTQTDKSIGIDLGLKTLATCSDGTKIENPKVLAKYAEKLAKAQRANKKKQVKKIHTKIKNVRKDFLHKESTRLINSHKQIFIGDVSSSKLVKTKMAKSVLDAGWGQFKDMLKYKAIRLGVDFQIVNEKYSSVTCSCCGAKAPFKSGLSTLGVRNWGCSECGSSHDRDVNAAKNIRNFALACQSPKGSPNNLTKYNKLEVRHDNIENKLDKILEKLSGA